MLKIVNKEIWLDIPEFPDYQISSYGNVYNIKRDTEMKTSINTQGHRKVNMISKSTGSQCTRSVALLAAQAFIERPKENFNQVTFLDGDFSNVNINNLVWRPKWFNYQYRKQLTLDPMLAHYTNLCVQNITTGVVYASIVDAGMIEGLLFASIWKSTWSENRIFPNWDQFEIVPKGTKGII